MTRFDDQTLVAFVDGELDPAQAQKIQSALSHDPELRERVHVLRESALILRTAFAEVVSEPVPLRLARTVAKLADAATQNNVRRANPKRTSRAAWAGVAVVAAIALMFGLAGGYVAADYRIYVEQGRKQTLAARQQSGVAQLVQATLEKKLSGTEASWRNPDTGEIVVVEPIRTFRNDEGHYCREYREAVAELAGSKHTQFGMACRSAEGVWMVRYHLVPGEDPPALFHN